MTIGIDDGRGAHTEAGHRVLDLVLTDQDWMVQHVEQSLCAKMLLRRRPVPTIITKVVTYGASSSQSFGTIDVRAFDVEKNDKALVDMKEKGIYWKHTGGEVL
ncbi:predicted protein [Postia placenta Mad-698-R]|uniref:Uncharacterized protein n=1 Tax=Postia placenta MAD-698-R-SB12 TaxID=670580 RepID=A0A1X6MNF6_9APHY|nr:hypothetical protein POSPLADRAFT_1049621 [Postia placenta MAD-698-R-SB12]EED81483.1 predicted protein [Postia placenta Mad-698-R]OSX57858.1 hypothetical protein POSPLADRAFT_1049621 [Postia placenta MAD-698-R-SB12]